MARTAEPLLRIAAAPAALRTHLTPAVPEAGTGLVAIEVAAAAARLANRELGFFAFGRLPFGPRQGGANETAMNRALVLAGRSQRNDVGVGVDIRVGAGGWRLRLDLRFGIVAVRGNVCSGCFCGWLGLFGSGTRTEDTLGRLAANRVSALAARRRYPRSLVLVVRITRRAPRLFHLIFNHRDDGVIGNAALARTVVVQNVTEPKPALLHSNFSGAVPFRWDGERCRQSAV
jgi:hypothetical protein